MEIAVKFECTAPNGTCIYKDNRNICIDPYADGGNVCPELKVIRA